MKNLATLAVMFFLYGFIFSTQGQWPKYVIGNSLANPAIARCGDFDGDGNKDVAVTSFSGNYVKWFKNLGTQPLSWSAPLFVSNVNGPVGIETDDLDGDGDIDFAIAANGESSVYWLENIGGYPTIWSKRIIDPNLPGAEFLRIIDMDGDNDLDMAVTGYVANDVVWYENTGGNPLGWSKHIIDSNLNGAMCLDMADLDTDGGDTLEVVATGRHANAVRWYKYSAGAWIVHTIDSNLDGAWGIRIADFDNDDTLDVSAVGIDANDVKWYKK